MIAYFSGRSLPWTAVALLALLSCTGTTETTHQALDAAAASDRGVALTDGVLPFDGHRPEGLLQPTDSRLPGSDSDSTGAPDAFVNPYHYYFGNTHSHTSYSDGYYSTQDRTTFVTPADHFALAKASGYDFYMTSDHALAKYANFTPQNWTNTRDQADAATDASFVAIAGFELSENDGPNGLGHLNAFDPPKFLDATGEAVRLSSFCDWLVHNNIIASFNHPQRDIDYDFDAFACPTAARREVLAMVEVFKAGVSFYADAVVALDQGWRVAPIVGIDNHQLANIPSWEVRTAVLARSLTRADLLEAMRSRRVYATRDQNLRVSYSVNGQIMGSVLAAPTALTFAIEASDPDTAKASDRITRIDILGEGGTVVATRDFSAHAVSWQQQLAAPTQRYYWVRVFTDGASGADNATAYLAPVWIDQGAPPVPSTCEVSQFRARIWDSDESGPYDYRGSQRLIVGDFNGDGQTDFAWFQLLTHQSQTYLSQGNGRFTARLVDDDEHGTGNLDLSLSRYQLIVGDLDGDGDTDFSWFDLATSRARSYLSNGDGTFAGHLQDEDEHPSGSFDYTSGHELVVGDFDGNGRTDFTLFQRATARTRTYLSQGDGRFSARVYDTDEAGDFDYSSSLYRLIPGDFDGDGRTDLTLFSTTTNNTRTYRSEGQGRFSRRNWDDDPGGDYSYDAAHQLVVGDFNGDGRTDFTWLDLRNAGTRSYLAESGGLSFSGRHWDGDEDGDIDYRPDHQLLVGDFDGDGATDFSWFNLKTNTSNTYLSQPGGRFSDRKWEDDEHLSGDYEYSSNHRSILGDFNGDGLSDFALINTSNGDTRTYLKQ